MIIQAILFWTSTVWEWLLSLDFGPEVWTFVGYGYAGVGILIGILPKVPFLPYDALGNVITVMAGTYLILLGVSLAYFFIRMTGLVKG